MKDLVLEGRKFFENFLSSIIKEEENDSDLAKSPNARIILDNEKQTVFIPRNYVAVKDIIPDTKWNLVFTNTAFSRYQKQKYTIYFIVLKKGSQSFNNNAYKKMAVIISPSGEYTCYDSTGSLLDINFVVKITSVAKNLFKQIK